MLPIVRPSRKESSVTHEIDWSGVIRTHESEAGKLKTLNQRRRQGVGQTDEKRLVSVVVDHSVRSLPPQNRTVAIY